MSFAPNFLGEGHNLYSGYWSTIDGNNCNRINRKRSRNNYYDRNYNNYHNSYYWPKSEEHGGNSNFYCTDHVMYVKNNAAPSSLKRIKHSASTWESICRHYLPPTVHDSVPHTRFNADTSTSASCKHDFSRIEDEEPALLSRDEIDRFSPSRKDGIDVLHETYLRYSYCVFLQNLGMRLELPQTTIATAMVLCHRFFFRRSHACHDRFLIATATLFLAAKSEETPCPLNKVLQASSEILHKQEFNFLSYFPDWFQQYRERVLEAEQLILTTLNFELHVQHPYAPLTSILSKIGLSHTVLVNLALNLISEGVFTSLTCWPV